MTDEREVRNKIHTYTDLLVAQGFLKAFEVSFVLKQKNVTQLTHQLRLHITQNRKFDD